MKKLISRVCCLCCVVLVLAACLPLSAFAVDPVSAGVMANAFAQAIAAYGASNGIAMTFDVSNTNGIGESVHELWKDFRNGTQDADDYETLAAALFPDLYYKALVAVGTASDVYAVGYNISSTYAEEFDQFFDWLLTGPLELQRVDDEYFQFQQAQVGSNAVPLLAYSNSTYSVNGKAVSLLPTYLTLYDSNNALARGFSFSSSVPLYCYTVVSSSYYNIICFTINGTTTTVDVVTTYANGDTTSRTQNVSSSDNGYYYYGTGYSVFASASNPNPLYSPVNGSNKPYDILGPLTQNSLETDADSLGIKAYNNTGVAELPNVDDPNYQAVAKRIPSTVPWNDEAFGEGVGDLTDAQSGAIATQGDLAIERDGILSLAETTTADPGGDPEEPEDEPSDDPDDYLAVGLEDLFPFCIPFDIYNFLSALAADPVAPHFTASLDFPQAIGGTQTIDIDFDSPTWNQLAQLLRLLELLAFIVGLALLTRSMFIRG